ncbi:MAG: lysozyme inhibitor LprI family protein [Methyloligellaceae bacterium]
MRFFVSVVVLFVLGIYQVSAGTMASRLAKFNCKGTASEAEMGACASRHLNKADKELNQLYGKLMASYKDDRPVRLNVGTRADFLRKAQREWIKFRDVSCKLETYDSIGGSGFGTIYTFCLLKYTQERVLYLRELEGAP